MIAGMSNAGVVVGIVVRLRWSPLLIFLIPIMISAVNNLVVRMILWLFTSHTHPCVFRKKKQFRICLASGLSDLITVV
jgi:hypothetical protein